MMRAMIRALGVAGLAAMALLAMACQTSGGDVVYVSEEEGDAEIYVVDPDSGESAPLVRLASSTESEPRLSPDGESVAFVSGDSGSLDIRVVTVGEEESVEADCVPRGERGIAALELRRRLACVCDGPGRQRGRVRFGLGPG